MKNVFKQLGKAICYLLLFTGSQFLISFIMQVIYGVKVGIAAASSGTTPSNQEIVEGTTEFLMNNMNWLALISGLLTLFILWLVFLIRRKKIFQEAGLHKFNKSKVLPLILLGGATAFFVSCVLSLLPLPESLMESYMESSQGLLSGNLAVMILSTVIVAPIVEEVVFRGLILSRLKKSMNVWVAIVISSLLFALLHGQLLWIIYTFFLGMLLAIIAEHFNTIGASIILHMAFNLVGVFGDKINIEKWQMLLIVAVSLVIMIAMLYIIRKKDKTYEVVV